MTIVIEMDTRQLSLISPNRVPSIYELIPHKIRICVRMESFCVCALSFELRMENEEICNPKILT